MDLEKAFGSEFTFTSKTVPLLQPDRLGVDKVEEVKDTEKITKPKINVEAPVKSPDVYLLQIQIGRDDCHLVCMFLLVFIISFLLSRK